MKRTAFGVLAAGIFLACSACSSAKRFEYKFEMRPLTIVTEPAGAEVYQTLPFEQPRARLGVTPIRDLNVMVIHSMTFEKMTSEQAQDALRYCDNVGVEIRKEGFKPYVGFLPVSKGPAKEHRISLEPIESGR